MTLLAALLILANEFRLGENVTLHCVDDSLFGGRGSQVRKDRIKGVEFEKVPMLSNGRRGTTVTCVLPIVFGLHGTIGQVPLLYPLGEPGRRRWEIVQDPVHPRELRLGGIGGIRVVDDEGEALGIWRHIGPFQRRGAILSVAPRVYGGDVSPVVECWRRNRKHHAGINSWCSQNGSFVQCQPVMTESLGFAILKCVTDSGKERFTGHQRITVQPSRTPHRRDRKANIASFCSSMAWIGATRYPLVYSYHTCSSIR